MERLNKRHLKRVGATAAQNSMEQDILQVRRVVASNPNTPKPVLSRLSGDEATNIRRCVAENPRCPVEVLKRLSLDPESEVRLAVAENGNTPIETLADLAADDNVDVRFGVAENPHMPDDILFALTRDDNPYIRCRAIKTLQMRAPDVQTRLRFLIQLSQHEKMRRDIEFLG